MSTFPFKRKRVAVFPPPRCDSEGRLLDSLAELYPVDFVRGGEIGRERMDAAVFFPEAWGLSDRVFECGVSSFRFACTGRGTLLPADARVTFSPSAALHVALRNAPVPLGADTRVPELTAGDGDIPLACHGSVRLWQFRPRGPAEMHTSAVAPPEVRGEQLLWSWLRPADWAALLPLAHFLRGVTAEADWSPGPTQACFIFDDPNLHSVRYGYLDFTELAHESLAHKYHVALATVPLDSWYAAPAAVEVFLKSRDRLSLLIHGNDHVANELAREPSPDEALSILAQALQRVDRFERRTGLKVARVIAPPHGGCSRTMLEQMLRLPFEGVCTSVGSLVQSHHGSFPLGFGLSPVSFLAGGFPILRRWDLHYGLAPLRFAAFLNQPIIPYGHHHDCANGVGRLAEVADTVNSWGPTTWTDPESIFRGQYRTKIDGELLHVEMCSRRIHVAIPPAVSWVMAHAPAGVDGEAFKVGAPLGAAGTGPYGLGVPIPLAGSALLELSMVSHSLVDPFKVPRPGYKIWAPIRRALAILRDRLAPMVRRPARPSGSPGKMTTEQHTASPTENGL